MAESGDVNGPNEGFVILPRPREQYEPEIAAGAIDQSVGMELWGWQPGYDFPDAFGQGAYLCLRCHRTRAGDRVFFPHWLRANWEDYVQTAANYGVGVIEQKDRDASLVHAVLTTLFLKARHTDKFLSRRFAYHDDLVKTDGSRRGVLPPRIRSDTRRKRGWVVGKETAGGRVSGACHPHRWCDRHAAGGRVGSSRRRGCQPRPLP